MDVFVTIDSAGAAGVKVSINRPVADGYCAALRELAQSYGLSDDISVSLLSRFPDVLLVEKEEEDAEQVAQDISAVMEQALSDCAEAFKDGGLEYSTKYRVRCKDGSLKWIIDSGKRRRTRTETGWSTACIWI